MKDDGYIDISLPTVTEPGIKAITAESATVAFNILSEGSSEVFEAGIIYGNTPDLSIDSGIKVVADEDYTIQITGLEEGAKYYVVSYATNTYGTAYSKAILCYTEHNDTEILSRYATANCYIVSEEGSYAFDATLKGNSFQSVGLPAKAEVLWETADYIVASAGTIVRDVELKNNLVTFVASGIEGNALIAVKDADGVILWSWHIWVTDQPEELSYSNKYGEFSVLDRNLGATRADRGVDDEWKNSSGLVYQWGRKDPFANDCYESRDTILTRQESVELPTIVAANNGQWNSEWDSKIWGFEKTIHDPCPIGYQVISKDAWAGFTKTGGNTSSASDIYAFNKFDHGWNFYLDNYHSTWYPATCHIGYSGSFGSAYSIGYCWCSTDSYVMEYRDNKLLIQNVLACQGFPVRCMKEQNDKFPIYTQPSTNVTKTSAEIHGYVETFGSRYIQEMGFVWSDTDITPDINSNKVCVDVQEGEFSYSLTNLTPGTTYHVRTFAVEHDAVHYGQVIPFTTQTTAGNENIPEDDDYEW
jgi:hypothetical protein